MIDFTSLRRLGLFSRVINLVHMPVLPGPGQIAVWQGFWHWVVGYLPAKVGLIGIGALVWRFFEHPIIEWNKRRE